MTDKRDKDRRLDLVGADRDERPSRHPGSELVRATAGTVELDAADHEALLALTLGEEVSELTETEFAEAEKLRAALEGGAVHPLADLAQALRAADLRDTLEHADHEAILAMVVRVDPRVDEEEHAQAAGLAEALEGRGRHPLTGMVTALRATRGDKAIANEDHDALVALALGQDIAASSEERSAAALLASAIDERRTDTPLAELAGALRATQGGRLHDLALERAVRRAIPRGRSTSIIVGAIVAFAAGVALFFGSWSYGERNVPAAEAGMVAALIQSRSTQELFDPGEPFPASGGESDRMERIVSSRAGDLRKNRFMAWGVP
jgi:hypothetical protein